MIPKIRLVVQGDKTKKAMVLAVFDEPDKAEIYIGKLLEILKEGFKIFTEEIKFVEDKKDNVNSN